MELSEKEIQTLNNLIELLDNGSINLDEWNEISSQENSEEEKKCSEPFHKKMLLETPKKKMDPQIL